MCVKKLKSESGVVAGSQLENVSPGSQHVLGGEQEDLWCLLAVPVLGKAGQLQRDPLSLQEVSLGCCSSKRLWLRGSALQVWSCQILCDNSNKKGCFCLPEVCSYVLILIVTGFSFM